jgi:Fe2+ or Zn2+ uptake regulation protein
LTILDAVRDLPAGTHLTAAEVFEAARRLAPRIGFATVHRGLARLHEAGLVEKVEVPGAAAAVYERVAPPHAHFRCTICGAISDVAFTVPSALLAALSAEHGLHIAAEHTTFAGRCAACKTHA